MSDVIVQRATVKDVPAIYNRIQKLAQYEQAPDEVTLSLEQFTEDGFGERPVWQAVVAKAADQVVGFGLWYMRYSTWKGRRLYLEDLYVDESWRRAGVATALMDALVETARLNNCSGMVWQVLGWNEPAKAFYRAYHPNIRLDDGWENVTLPIDL
ncbi:MAG: GNAT family N-acetyltransferase [Sphingobacteriales bacterium]|nr:MAG: GNAT family N-acetyltransferase [Sphingobacteriales bacterium]